MSVRRWRSRPVQSRGDRRGWLTISVIVVEKPGGEADGRIRNAVEGLRARCPSAWHSRLA